jgi:2-polyprenyl-3-methyl-5-hydroxy-6-metoxy-1,4-benzoquinol methylase
LNELCRTYRANVLDVGCGTGKPVAMTLAAAGHSVTGIDISDIMIALSQKAVPSGRFHLLDVKEYEPPSGPPFDAVFNILCLFCAQQARD